MPAARTGRKARRVGEDAFQLSWTSPVEPTAPQTFSFAPNVTPGTFTEPPPSAEDIPSESTLFPPADDTPSSTQRLNHGKKRPEHHIPRPPNAFILFRSSFIKSQHVSSTVEGNHGTLSKIVGMLWHNLPYEERQVWQGKARRALAEHKRRFPEYSFRPLHSKEKDGAGGAVGGGGGGTGAAKRKVRDCGPRDVERCEKIATLLASGKKGAELAAAVEEFDRQHVPMVTTRFEAPLTARQYRRSSSAPAPDTENSKAQAAFIPSKPEESPRAKRMARASSSRPEGPRIPAALSRQPTLIIDTPRLETNSEWFYDDSSFSSDMSMASSPSAAEFSYDQESTFDFNGFNFSSECTTPMSDSFSPFEQAPTPQSPGMDDNALGMFVADGFAGHENPFPQTHYHPIHMDSPQPQPLSVQTSFQSLDSWSTGEYSPSPLSATTPNTPDTLSTSCYALAAQMAFDQYNEGAAHEFNAHAANFDMDSYSVPAPFDEAAGTGASSPCASEFAEAVPLTGCMYPDLAAAVPQQADFGQYAEFAFSAPGFHRQGQEESKIGVALAELDPEFSRFMSTLPQY